MSAPRLTRAALAEAGTPLPASPVRIVHIGVGAFHRAHQAWYTARAGDGWGIAAFTGRDAAVAQRLAPQDGLYTLVERGPDADRFEVVGSIAEVHASTEIARFLELFASPSTAVVTVTVTEQGYHLRPDGALDLSSPAIAADVRALYAGGHPTTPIGRIVRGLAERRRAGAGPIAIVSCDNLPANGDRLRAAVVDLAEAAGLTGVADRASFVSTSVDRITPHELDIDAVERATGWRDEAPVVTEPFSDWTLSGEFPAGRPRWEDAGARFVDDIEPFEQRKLLLLNGGHLQLAFQGLLRGHETIADAMRDADCLRALDDFWAEAARTVGPAVDPEAYCAALRERFENPRIAHRLAQIAADTVTKLRLRIVPVVEAERAAGRDAAGALSVVAAWSRCVAEGVLPDGAVRDAPAEAVATLVSGVDATDASAIAAAAATLKESVHTL
ncbi:mannitol dehydrogenase family protein [Microbacterium ulmi]|uniref:Mannitol dehydrogenase family protein n=1 Tax=Microbacterium ulmi TaxID=179095 RepID=A0A7Y2M2I1_9MICO|nr:fructuronate reductase [Microbacterium ulmi]NNH04569.1 mannitol dehydrogenase family protein [Microbacterium ulmi]